MTLLNLIQQDEPLEVSVKAVVTSFISLFSLFRTISPICLSFDEMFLAVTYHEPLK
jgi:hypothetical protein